MFNMVLEFITICAVDGFFENLMTELGQCFLKNDCGLVLLYCTIFTELFVWLCSKKVRVIVEVLFFLDEVRKLCTLVMFAFHCASQRCPLDKLLMLAAKAQTSLAFARLHVTFAFSDGLPLL